MEKTGIFYGSTLGYCKKIAEKIYQKLGSGNADLNNIESAKPKDFKKYKNLILGTSTWGVGEMQEDWENFAHQLEQIDMTGKKIAFFGIGDQVEWGDSFVNGMGMLNHRISKFADVVGFTSLEGYDFEISLAVKDNKFVGLAINDVNQPELTDKRIEEWIEQLKKEFN
ncbi:MAG: flavodoxin [Bacteroidales bacterium]|nr:flavodoxin [Bacteroidales bacterium]